MMSDATLYRLDSMIRAQRIREVDDEINRNVGGGKILVYSFFKDRYPSSAWVQFYKQSMDNHIATKYQSVDSQLSRN